MKQIRIIFILGLFLLFLTARVHSQQSINAAGGDNFGAGGTVSYSVAQIFYNSSNGSDGSIVEGVQQAYEISTLTNQESINVQDIDIAVYPNPTTEYLIVKFDKPDLLGYSFQLIDIDGKTIYSDIISSCETNLFVGNIKPSTYFLKVTQNGREINVFKIVKY